MIEWFIMRNPAVFLCNSRRAFLIGWCRLGLPVFVAVVCVISLCGCGCGKKKDDADSSTAAQNTDSSTAAQDTTLTGRINNKEYLAALKAHQNGIKAVARKRNQLGCQMKVVAERVKAGLPADASNEDFKAALEKDKEWQELLKKQKQTDQDVQDALSKARKTIQQGMLREQQGTATAPAKE